LAELRAIELWDKLFQEFRPTDELDMIAWVARGERRIEICIQLISMYEDKS
jgi:hypothetical protein